MTETIRPITVAIAALGGQGGGVLSNWIVDIAEHANWLVQSTSVPGVAQRTGATIYCIEMFPRAEAEKAGKDPVFALMPMPGDVDIVIASELMEAGRAINRGFVTPETTTLIASTHREYAISEKSAMGSGIADEQTVLKHAQDRARTFIAFDMQALAEETGSVISSTLLGALCGSGALPFDRSDYEDAIRRSGRAVEANLAGFARGFERARSSGEKTPSQAAESVTPEATGAPASKEGARLLGRIEDELPLSVRDLATEGVRRCVDYQDPKYADQYLDRLAPFRAYDKDHDGDDSGYPLTRAVARHLALWMTYEDTIRVADLKTRASRFDRLEKEVRATPDQVVYMTEFMHPRLEEIADTMPAPIGRWILRSRLARAVLNPLTRKGRHIKTAKLSGFFLLYFVARLRWIRRSTLRYKVETERIEAWLKTVRETAEEDYELAVALAGCQRLIKGYGETHERGLSNYNRIIEALAQIRQQPDPAATVVRLRDAALSDEEGEALTEAIDALDRDNARDAAE